MPARWGRPHHQGREVLPGVDAFGCLCSLGARLIGKRGAGRLGLKRSRLAIGRVLRNPRRRLLPPWASLLLGARFGLLSHGLRRGLSEHGRLRIRPGNQARRLSRVHFSPRGGGVAWAMPLGVGIRLATGKHAVCFVGAGGGLFSIHALWTAAKHAIPSIFVCFVNHEYRLVRRDGPDD